MSDQNENSALRFPDDRVFRSCESLVQGTIKCFTNCFFSFFLFVIFLAYKHNCSDIVVPACQGIPGYTKTVVSEAIQRRYQNHIVNTIGQGTNSTCQEKRKEIVCAENLPGCIDGSAAFLCRDTCEKFFNTCKSPFFYGIDMCMEFPSRETTPKSASICKQTHWPRAENWDFRANPTGMNTA